MSSIQDDVTYHLTNVKSGTRMELDKDEREVGASPPNAWPYQKWVFHKIGNNFQIKSVQNGKFLAPSALGDGKQLIVLDNPIHEWVVKDESPDTVRIHPVEDTKFSVDLKGGDPAPGTPVQLWTNSPGDLNQVWKMEKV